MRRAVPRRWTHSPRVALAALLAACSSGDASPNTTPAPIAPPICDTCAPTFPTAPCAPGTAPLEGTECRGVGWTDACPAGFAKSASGWGCEPVVTSAACADATMPKLGSAACVPVGDCSEMFPPADATRFVDAAAPADATHFHTIGDALANAADGDVIAIADGTYVEALVLARAVSLVGRCADRVRVESPGGSDPGITLKSGAQTHASGLTLTGHRGGIVVTSGSLEATGLRLEANRDLGLVVVGNKARVRFANGVIRKTLAMSSGMLGRGVDAEAGGTVELVEAAVEENTEIGVFAETASVTLDGSIVRTTALDAAGNEGRGVYGKTGATVVVRRSAITDNHVMGIFGAGAGTKLTVDTSYVARTLPDRKGVFGRGITVMTGAKATLTKALLQSNVDTGLEIDGGDAEAGDVVIASTESTPKNEYGAGVFVKRGGSLRVARSALVGNRDFAAVAVGGTLELEDSALLATRSNAGGAYGGGLLAAGGARASMTRSVLDDAKFAGVFALEAGSVVALDHALVARITGQESDSAYGHGVIAMDGARVDVTSSVIRQSAGVGLVFAAATGSIKGAVVREHPIAITTMDGTTLIEGDGSPEDGELVVSPDTRFEENGTRVGSGAVPLPPPPKQATTK